MRVVSVQELEMSLEECLARASQGEEIIVTEDGEAFARIVPSGAEDDDSLSGGRSES